MPAVITLLCAGFPERSHRYWERGLANLTALPAPPTRPRYGFILVQEARVVGALLLIYAPETLGARANVSSWYVVPEFRAYAALLVGKALRAKDVTYINISPAPATRPILTAQGYRPYVNGLLTAFPALARGRARVEALAPERHGRFLPAEELTLLQDHARLGAIVLLAGPGEAAMQPFVFARRRLTRLRLPGAQLIYCRDTQAFADMAGAIGRRLLREHRIYTVALDCDAPIQGLPGRFKMGNNPKYARGPNPPRQNDLAYTELAIFGD
ncbi:MAG: hypothetical protein KGQ46_04580 [Hyphomicrobiales bacterium]|nr:hypothetical protein [Hyphomicrobiales bacterium]